MYFEQIDQPSDVKRLKLNQLETLAAEMRQALLQKLSRRAVSISCLIRLLNSR